MIARAACPLQAQTLVSVLSFVTKFVKMNRATTTVPSVLQSTTVQVFMADKPNTEGK